MFNPNEHSEQCERYLSCFLGSTVKLIRAMALPQSTRESPWRLDVRVDSVERAFVLQVDPRSMEYEYRILKAVESIPVRTPRAYGLDMQGEALGVPCFFSDFIEGESLLGPMLAGEAWAEELYFDAVCGLHAVTDEDMGDLAQEVERIPLTDMIEEKYTRLKAKSFPLADAAYKKLKEEMPALPALRFSNGDLWLDNFIFKDGKLAGVIDFQNAAFSDPLFEFLLSFFVSPELQGRGIEERFCQHIGIDPAVLHWYHGLEYFDVLPRLLETGKNFVHHTAESVEANLHKWLDGDTLSG